MKSKKLAVIVFLTLAITTKCIQVIPACYETEEKVTQLEQAALECIRSATRVQKQEHQTESKLFLNSEHFCQESEYKISQGNESGYVHLVDTVFYLTKDKKIYTQCKFTLRWSSNGTAKRIFFVPIVGKPGRMVYAAFNGKFCLITQNETLYSEISKNLCDLAFSKLNI